MNFQQLVREAERVQNAMYGTAAHLYQKKPPKQPTYLAVQFRGVDSVYQIQNVLGLTDVSYVSKDGKESFGFCVKLPHAIGQSRLAVGDYLVKGPEGLFSVVPAEDFAATYEVAA